MCQFSLFLYLFCNTFFTIRRFNRITHLLWCWFAVTCWNFRNEQSRPAKLTLGKAPIDGMQAFRFRVEHWCGLQEGMLTGYVHLMKPCMYIKSIDQSQGSDVIHIMQKHRSWWQWISDCCVIKQFCLSTKWENANFWCRACSILPGSPSCSSSYQCKTQPWVEWPEGRPQGQLVHGPVHGASWSILPRVVQNRKDVCKETPQKGSRRRSQGVDGVTGAVAYFSLLMMVSDYIITVFLKVITEKLMASTYIKWGKKKTSASQDNSNPTRASTLLSNPIRSSSIWQTLDFSSHLNDLWTKSLFSQLSFLTNLGVLSFSFSTCLS